MASISDLYPKRYGPGLGRSIPPADPLPIPSRINRGVDWTNNDDCRAYKAGLITLEQQPIKLPRRGHVVEGLGLRFGWAAERRSGEVCVMSAATDFLFAGRDRPITLPLVIGHDIIDQTAIKAGCSDAIAGVARLRYHPFGLGLWCEGIIDAEWPHYDAFSRTSSFDWGFSVGAYDVKCSPDGSGRWHYDVFDLVEISLTTNPADPQLKGITLGRIFDRDLWMTSAEHDTTLNRFRTDGPWAL